MKQIGKWGAASLLVGLVACGGEPIEAPSTATHSEPLIYGADDRLDYYQASGEHRSWADSTVALLSNSDVSSRSDGRYQLSTSSVFGPSYGLLHERAVLVAAEPRVL